MLGHCLQRWLVIETLLNKFILIIKCKWCLKGAGMESLLQKAPIDWSKYHCTVNEALPDMYIIEPTLIHT